MSAWGRISAQTGRQAGREEARWMDGWMAVEMGGRQAYIRLLGSIGVLC